MTETTTFISRYDRRVTLVRDVVKANTKLDDEAAADLAVRVLGALDGIPAEVR